FNGNLQFKESVSGNDGKIQFHDNIIQKGPATGFWAGSPDLAYPDPGEIFTWFEDFVGHVSLPASSGSAGGWKAAGDATYDIVAAAGSLGGQIELTPETGSNNEVYFQLGEIGTETFLEYVKDSGKKSWVELRIAYASITNAANILVGLAEEGAAAGNFIHDDGNDLADKDVVGFVIWEGDPNAIDCIHQKAGGAFADPGLAAVPVAGVFLTLGIYFDGAETVGFYVNGSVVQTADLDTATFPTDEELSPILALKNGAADATLQIDWIKIVVER
ncbi:MAG: hypothetical protein JRC86_10860, partial [Deltaproteobacteria bacterium]|nr:hypothetical protein [Deltaproteobacteria bacterium]